MCCGTPNAVVHGVLSGTLKIWSGCEAKYLWADALADLTEIYGFLTVQSSYPVGLPTRDAINRSYSDTHKLVLIESTCACSINWSVTICLGKLTCEARGSVDLGSSSAFHSLRLDGICVPLFHHVFRKRGRKVQSMKSIMPLRLLDVPQSKAMVMLTSPFAHHPSSVT